MKKRILSTGFLVWLLWTASCSLFLGENSSSSADSSSSSSVSIEPRTVTTGQIGYEIFVRSFKDSDGDGTGDFNGVTEKLDYLTNLGVTVLWLMPIQKSPSYHGYDVSDYRAVEPDYGTMSDFENLLAQAHIRGLKVIIDLVVNHTASDNAWFTASEQKDPTYKDWYIWTNASLASLDSAGWGSPWGGGSASSVWHTSATRSGELYYGAFNGGMPDLNYRNPAVKNEMFSVADFWLNKGVDGFRLDAVRYCVEDGPGVGQADTTDNHNFLKDFQAHVKSVQPNAITVGEVWESLSVIDSYYENGAGLSACFDFSLADGLFNSILYQDSTSLKNYLNQSRSSWDFYAPFWANHDQNRVMSTLSGYGSSNAMEELKLGYSVLLTLPGMPFLYYGEEIGMSGSGSDPEKRKAMQWENSANAGFSTTAPEMGLESDYSTINVASQEADTGSLWNRIRKLSHLRTSYDALQSDVVQTLGSDSHSVVAYFRPGETDGVLVVVNLSSNTQTVDIDFTGSAVPSSGSFTDLLGTRSFTALSTGNHAAYAVSLNDREVLVLLTSAVGTVSSSSSAAVVETMTVKTEISGNAANMNWMPMLYWNGNHILYTIEPAVFTNGILSGTYLAEVDTGTFGEYFYSDLNTNQVWDDSEIWLCMGVVSGLQAGTNVLTSEINTNHVKIEVNTVLNALSNVYLYATAQMMKQNGNLIASYRTSMAGDVLSTPYALYDDGSHEDSVSNDGIFTLGMDLFEDSQVNLYQFKFRDATNKTAYIGSIYLLNTNSTNLTLNVQPSTLPTNLTVIFRVNLNNVSATTPGVRGDEAGVLSWVSNLVFLNDAGTNGDETAGDLIYSGAANFSAGSSTYFEYKFNKTDSDTGWEENIANRNVVLNTEQPTNVLPISVFDQP